MSKNHWYWITIEMPVFAPDEESAEREVMARLAVGVSGDSYDIVKTDKEEEEIDGE